MYLSKLKELKLTIPNIDEQKQICVFLNKLDNLITVNQDRILILQKSSIFTLTL